MSNLKKILLGVLLLAVVSGLFFVIYYLFFKPSESAPTPVENTNTVPGSGLPQAGEGGNLPYVPPLTGAGALTAASPVARGGATISPTLVNSFTLGATLSSNGNTVRYYDQATGKFMIVDADGKTVSLSEETFPNVVKVTWSGDSDKAVMEFPDNSKIVYNFATKKQSTIPASWSSFSFSPGSDRMAALQISDSAASRYLVTANADGSGTQAVESLGNNADAVTVAWSPAGDVLALSETGEPGSGGFGSKEVLFIGANGENFRSTEVNGLNFTPIWSPDGSYLLYSAAGGDDDFKPRLFTVTGGGENRGGGRRAINLFTTADKCVFSTTKIAYCAVPDSMPEGAGLSPEVMIGIPDSIYKLNVATGAITLIGRPDVDTTISSLTVSTDGGTLFFTDQISGNIKKMMLK